MPGKLDRRIRSVEHLPIEHILAAALPLTDDELRTLSRAASRLVGGDAVGVEQAQSYLAYFTEADATLRWLRSHSVPELAEYVASPSVLKPRHGATAGRPWLRGIVATYLALQSLVERGWPGREQAAS